MFSGIIEKKSTITLVGKKKTGIDVIIAKPKGFLFQIGDSVSIDGICSTVAAQTKHTFTVHYMKETLERTISNLFSPMRDVNLEQSIRYGDRVHGHLVQGHVSSVASVVAIQRVTDAWNISLRIQPQERRYIVYKGSITINGVSLTITKKTKEGCMVSIIPHTLSVTTLGDLEVGDVVNIETDFLLRAYLQS